MATQAQPGSSLVAPLQRPLPLRFTSLHDWLRAWVELRHSEQPPHRLYYDNETGKPSVGLSGSIGMDSAITVDGEVWVQFGMDEDELDGWRPARPNERVALLVSAQRLYPELAVLLPLRPVEAIDCPSCNGQGVLFGIAWCTDCSARGWLLAGLDTRLESASAAEPNSIRHPRQSGDPS
jgi:hypothetical protein